MLEQFPSSNLSMNNNYVYGIDFGTSNTAISVVDTRTQKMIYNFIDSSLLYFPDQEELLDGYPLKYEVGKKSKELHSANELKGRYMKSLKRLLHKPKLSEINIYRRIFEIEELIGLILFYFKQHADNYLGLDIKKVVLGRPVVFDTNPENDQLAQDRLFKAAQIAGFKEISFELEPIAAAYSYEQSINKEEKVLIADFGGGTSDFTVMKLGPEKRNKINRSDDILGQDGIYIGGDSFDYSMMWHKVSPHFGRGLKYWDFSNQLEIPRHFFIKMCDWEQMHYFDNKKVRNRMDYIRRATGNDPKFNNLIQLVEQNLAFSVYTEGENAK